MPYTRHTTLKQIVGAMSLATTLFTSSAQVPPDSTEPPAPACPGPAIDTKSWQVVTLKDCGIRLKLPREYKEHKWEVVVNDAISHSYRAGNFNRIDIDVERPMIADPNQNKTIRQADYEGFSECKEVIGGREAILQSFRGGGVIISAGRYFRTYHAEGLWPLKAERLVTVSGDVASRESQEEVLVSFGPLSLLTREERGGQK